MIDSMEPCDKRWPNRGLISAQENSKRRFNGLKFTGVLSTAAGFLYIAVDSRRSP